MKARAIDDAARSRTRPVAVALAVAALGGGAVAATTRAVASTTPAPASATIRFVVDGRSIANRFPRGPSIALRAPSNWHVSTRRLDNVIDPRTVAAVSTYRLQAGPVDDCDGSRARGRPPDGAFILLKEVVDGASISRSLPRLSARPHHFTVPTGGRAGCLPSASVAYQFRVAKRAFYLWVSVGPRASARTRSALAAVLDRMWIARYPFP